MIVMKGGVTAAIGFVANGVKAGIKKSGSKDLALLYSEVPAVAAGSFTTNRFEASPVKISKLHIRNKTHQAVIVNSGNANCANGKDGDNKAVLMAECAAKSLWLDQKRGTGGVNGHNRPPFADKEYKRENTVPHQRLIERRRQGICRDDNDDRYR